MGRDKRDTTEGIEVEMKTREERKCFSTIFFFFFYSLNTQINALFEYLMGRNVYIYFKTMEMEGRGRKRNRRE